MSGYQDCRQDIKFDLLSDQKNFFRLKVILFLK